jgi:pSer/pThr/pTyr-binding forkhead associated (FHA) protein
LSFAIGSGAHRIGRADGNHLRMPDGSVSSSHCEVALDLSGNLIVRDLGSTNGTYIDGQAIHETPLVPGQILRLGSAELKLNSLPVQDLPQTAVPEPKIEQPPSSGTLPDDSASCLNHREIRATLKCVKCQQMFCEDCVHVLRLAGGRIRAFCPSCSAPCEPLPGATLPSASLKPKKQSLFGRLTQTIRIHFK